MLTMLNSRSAQRQKEAERQEKWRHLRPLTAHVYVENRCHMKCDHCYESEETHPASESLSLKDYENIFDQLAGLGVLRITISGGEIFLRRDLLEIVAKARERRFEVTLYTSGTHINAEKADRIAALKVHEVHISVYSHLAEVHDRFTKTPGSWERSIRAVKLLRERGVTTVMKTNLMTFNINSVDDLTAQAERLGSEWTFDPGVYPRMNGDQSPAKYRVSTEQIRRLVSTRPDLTPAFRRFSPETLCTGEASLLGEKDVLCGAARSNVTVGADGGVYACAFFPTPSGYLKEKSLEEIWFSSDQFDKVRENTFGKMASCSDCDVKQGCHPCMAYSLIENGHLQGCNTASRSGAEAMMALARYKSSANRKMRAGRPLRVVAPEYQLAVPPKRPRLESEL